MKRSLLSLCLVLALCASCEEETNVVDFTVEWTIGLESPDPVICGRAGIESIHVQLDGASDSYERQVSCDRASISFENIPQTGYDLIVSGLNEDGCPIYYGEGGLSPSRLDEGPETIRLESVEAKGTVSIVWYFPDSLFCSHHGSDDVRIVIYKDDVEIINEEVSCDDGIFELDEVGTGRYSIRVETEADEGFLCSEYHDLTLEPCGSIDIESPFEQCPE